jgi:hypothetical protein
MTGSSNDADLILCQNGAMTAHRRLDNRLASRGMIFIDYRNFMTSRLKAFAAAGAALFLTSAVFAGDIQCTVNPHATLTRAIGSAVCAEDAVYLVVSITAKNLTPKKHFLTEMFGRKFQVKSGEFSFNLDGRAGWQEDTATGDEPLNPLMTTHFKLAFTVPNELAHSNWTLVTPDEQTFEVASK